MDPEMRLVRAPARSAALSTYSMAFSVDELARSVPPTARMYGELKKHSRSNQAWQRSYTETRPWGSVCRVCPRAEGRLCEPDQRYQQQEQQAQHVEYIVDAQRRCLTGDDE